MSAAFASRTSGARAIIAAAIDRSAPSRSAVDDVITSGWFVLGKQLELLGDESLSVHGSREEMDAFAPLADELDELINTLSA